MAEARDPVISMELRQNVKINGVVLRLTCQSCPEQYDAYIGGEKVGLFIVIEGYFFAQYLFDGPNLYESNIEGFRNFTDEERYQHLNAACKALFKRHMGTDI